jgi:hypothetical protein
LTSNTINCEMQEMVGRSGKPESQRAALLMLAQGYSPGQVARHAGVSRQLIESWAVSHGVDWRRIQQRQEAAAWRRALTAAPPKLPSRAKLRAIAAKAKRDWDKANGRGPA